MLQPNEHLSVNEKKLFQFIRLYSQKFGYQPDRKEMASYFEVKPGTITDWALSMEKKGWIKRIDKRAIALFDEVNLKRSFSIKK